MRLFRHNQTSLESFIRLVESSGLLHKDVLQQAYDASTAVRTAAELDAHDGVTALAEHLVRSGLLTPWQCEKLLDGRWKGFFIGPFKLLGHVATTDTESIYLAEEIYLNRRVHMHVMPHSEHGPVRPDWHIVEGVQFKIVEID